MKYKIRAKYISERELIVEGEPDVDMKDPANWGEFESEDEVEFYLEDVVRAEEVDE